MNIYQITTTAELQQIASLEKTLPWWLFDRIPQGFAGRAFAKQILKALPQLPTRLTDWSDDVILQVLTQFPRDAIGNMLFEQADVTRYQALQPRSVSLSELPSLAQQASDVCTTLIAGDQPKFCCDFEQRGPCIVKFASTPRASDLLIAEHTALSVLNQAGIAAAHSMLGSVGGDLFLVIERFDCLGGRGRRGLLSLRALDLEFVGARDHRWPSIAAELAKQALISSEQLSQIQRLFCFGRLIANTDMHAGNLSFFDDHLTTPPYVLTPAYDMLPMAFMSEKSTENFTVTLDPDLPKPIWQQIYPIALQFWQQLADEALLSTTFQQIAKTMQANLQQRVYPNIR